MNDRWNSSSALIINSIDSYEMERSKTKLQTNEINSNSTVKESIGRGSKKFEKIEKIEKITKIQN